MLGKTLEEKAAHAARLRRHRENPDVVALRVERVRRLVDTLVWGSIIAGLAYTMTNVQAFASRGEAKDSPGWWAAWGLEPAMSLLLLAMLLGEQVLGRWQVSTRATHDGLLNWIKVSKWAAFAATYTMNTWESWHGLVMQDKGAAGVVLHSVPPVLVLCAAEAGPRMRDRLAEAVRMAAAEAEQGVRPVRRAEPKPVATTPRRTGTAKATGLAVGRAAGQAWRALGGAVQWSRVTLWLFVAQAGAASVGLAGPVVTASGPAGPEAAGPEAAGPEAAGPEAAGPEAAGPEAAGPEAAGPEAAGPGSRVVPPETASELTAPYLPVDRPVAPQVTIDDLPADTVARVFAWAEEKHRQGVKLTRAAIIDGLRDEKVASLGHLMRTPVVKAVQTHVETLVDAQ